MNRIEVNLPDGRHGVLRFEGIERGGVRTLYSASIVVMIQGEQHTIGYAQRERGNVEYRAYVGGRLAASNRSLVELRYAVREHLEAEGIGSEE